MDILDARLKAGIMVKDYVAKYGDQENDLATVMKCMFSSRVYGNLLKNS
jgi:hypothetical protein